MNKEFSFLEKMRDQYIEESSSKIREYVKSQLDDWQKVPWLALEADGRGGYSSKYSAMYNCGLATISGVHYVDLVSGDLVSVSCYNPGKSDDENLRVMDDFDISRLSFYSLDKLNAKSLISKLEKEMERPDQDYTGTGFKTNREWRNSFRRLGFTENSFVRL